ncbi:MAG: hypothetical protein HQL37_09930, partial [Alphaproteobacteria bacterium]|nr:hypothetical protein [Alphaproteobacteria bacterium]
FVCGGIGAHGDAGDDADSGGDDPVTKLRGSGDDSPAAKVPNTLSLSVCYQAGDESDETLAINVPYKKTYTLAIADGLSMEVVERDAGRGIYIFYGTINGQSFVTFVTGGITPWWRLGNRDG